MKTLILGLLVAWLVLSVVGALVKGLLWLLVVGVVLFAATAAYGWFRMRRDSSNI